MPLQVFLKIAGLEFARMPGWDSIHVSYQDVRVELNTPAYLALYARFKHLHHSGCIDLADTGLSSKDQVAVHAKNYYWIRYFGDSDWYRIAPESVTDQRTIGETVCENKVICKFLDIIYLGERRFVVWDGILG